MARDASSRSPRRPRNDAPPSGGAPAALRDAPGAGGSDLEALAELDAGGAKDRQFVTALARGLEVLRAFTPEAPLLGNQELAARTRLPKPTISRLTHTLTRLGYLVYVERLGKYQLGAPVLSLGYAALSGMSVRQVAKPLMQQLADYAGVGVSLGSRDRLEIVYVEHCRSNARVTLRLDVGSRIPLASTAMGRALLAALEEPERRALTDHLVRRAPTHGRELRASIAEATREHQARGFVVSCGEWDPGVNAVGAALVSPGSGEVLAFNCGGPSFLLPKERLEGDLGPRLAALVRDVEARLARG